MTSLLVMTLMAATPVSTPGAGTEGRDFVTLLSQAKWKPAQAMLDPTMSNALSGDKLPALWSQVVGKLGAFEKIERVDVDQPHGMRRDTVICTFAKDRAGLQVVVDSAGKVAGFFIVPATDAAATPAGWHSAPYVDATRFTETPIEVGPQHLTGALVVPQGLAQFPIVVMLSGSGPNDLDESIPPIKVFRDLAEGLGTHGIASLRFEKRTHRHLPVTTVKEEYLDDASAAIAQAAAVKGVSKVILLGHSLGAMMAPRVALGNTQVAGVILLAGSTWSYAKGTVAQLEYQKKLGVLGPNGDKLLAETKAEAQKIDDPALQAATPMGHGITGAYFLDLRSYDAVATTAKLTVPVFLAWGDRDLLIIPDDWAGWKAKLGERPNLTFRTYPGLQHLFTPVGTPEVGHVAPAVITDLSSWIAK